MTKRKTTTAVDGGPLTTTVAYPNGTVVVDKIRGAVINAAKKRVERIKRFHAAAKRAKAGMPARPVDAPPKKMTPAQLARQARKRRRKRERLHADRGGQPA